MAKYYGTFICGHEGVVNDLKIESATFPENKITETPVEISFSPNNISVKFEKKPSIYRNNKESGI